MTDYDSIYHRLFDHAGMVPALLREFVPKPWLDDFDLDGVTRENAKLHADSGERREGDTAWCIPRRSGGATYLLLLLEFQSNIASRMALRMLVYAGLLWQHLEREKRLLPGGRLPPVLPIVLYRGGSAWAAPLSLRPLIGLPADSPLWNWQPDIPYYIVDIGRLPEVDLARRDGFLPLWFRLESASDLKQLRVVARAFSLWFKANPAHDTLHGLVTELLKGALKPLAPGMPVPDVFGEFDGMLAERVEEWKQQWLQEGRQEGRQEGEEIGERKGEAALLLRLLERRFGVLPAWVFERVGAAQTALLEEWGLRVLDAGSLDDIFA